jgi:hypothetical protein
VDLSSPALEEPEEESAVATEEESAAVAPVAASRKADTPESYPPDERSAPASMEVEEE